MKVTMEMNVYDVRDAVWSGAKDTVSDLSDEELQIIMDALEDLAADSGDAISMTELNDFLWFERETIAEWLGYESYDDIINRPRC